jgi:isoleucyl-tRNA synthetase
MSSFLSSSSISLITPAKLDSVTAPPSSIRAAADATAKREIESQKAQFRHFGIMADWSAESTYRTLGMRYLNDVSISR